MTYLAFDLGASSGRAMLGKFQQSILTLHEIHRFENNPVMIEGLLSWDVPTLYDHIKEGLKKAIVACDDDLVSIGIDAWGVDIALLDEHMSLVRMPLHYRNKENIDQNMESLFERVSKKHLYQVTGIQSLNINTIFQLHNLIRHHPDWMRHTKRIMMIPDLINYWLTGVTGIEHTIASTTGMLNLETKSFDQHIMNVLDVDSRLFGDVFDPGTKVGPLRQETCDGCDLHGINVIRVASHDTASAVIGIPFTHQNSTFISSGTWSLIGKEMSSPILSDDAKNANFTNEGGYGGTIRFLKNISGLFILQELQKAWEDQGLWEGYEDLERQAATYDTRHAVIDVDDSMLQRPGDMEQKLIDHLDERQMAVPDSPGGWARLIYESLAVMYGKRLRQLDELTQTTTSVIHLVGGGAKSTLLAQLTANQTGVSVLVGPCESTVIGNIVVQAIEHGEFQTLDDARKAILTSFPPTLFTPGQKI
ncbi:MAG: rhamnulokinase [Acholeplasmataceae bacterium]|nr:rhamnulokinase [Acholeplasmataceae bacterium]